MSMPCEPEIRISLRSEFILEDVSEMVDKVNDEIDAHGGLPGPEALRLDGEDLVIDLFDRTKKDPPTYNIGSYSKPGIKTYTLQFENIIEIRILAVDNEEDLGFNQQQFEGEHRLIPIGKVLKWNWFDYAEEFDTIPPHLFQLYIMSEDVILDDLEAQSQVDNWLNKLNKEK